MEEALDIKGLGYDPACNVSILVTALSPSLTSNCEGLQNPALSIEQSSSRGAEKSRIQGPEACRLQIGNKHTFTSSKVDDERLTAHENDSTEAQKILSKTTQTTWGGGRTQVGM